MDLQGLNVLTLQITRECFYDILRGRQKTESRHIYPNNAKRYIIEHENGDGTADVEVVAYDALQLINGRRQDAPRLLVEQKGADIIQLTDEEGNYVTYVQRGETYYATDIVYQLGDVLASENTDPNYK